MCQTIIPDNRWEWEAADEQKTERPDMTSRKWDQMLDAEARKGSETIKENRQFINDDVSAISGGLNMLSRQSQSTQ